MKTDSFKTLRLAERYKQERDAALAAMQVKNEALELARRNYIRAHASNLNQLKTMPTPFDEAILR